jgi:hypothetical protein
MLDSNRSGEFRLTLTNSVVLAVATNEFGINEAATWAISILGTNAVTNASSISGWGDLAWTNSTTIPNDVIFRKSAGTYTVKVRK